MTIMLWDIKWYKQRNISYFLNMEYGFTTVSVNVNVNREVMHIHSWGTHFLGHTVVLMLVLGKSLSQLYSQDMEVSIVMGVPKMDGLQWKSPSRYPRF